MRENAPYPKPSAMGGTLIRKVMALFKAQSFSLPIREPILIATSGGVDSMVLAHLLSRYGRKIVDPKFITLLHFDHQWRKESFLAERKAVEKLAYDLGVSFLSRRLASPNRIRQSQNLEEDARIKRRGFYDASVGPRRPYRYVLTAHHQDDVAETLFWRFLRGEFDEQRKGILFCDDQQLRPFLRVKKQELYEYARQEKVVYFEDPTNQTLDRMRGFLRHEIFPRLKAHFPSLSDVLSGYVSSPSFQKGILLPELVEILAKARMNRTQRLQLEEMIKQSKVGTRTTVSKGLVIERQKRGFFIEIIDEEDSV